LLALAAIRRVFPKKKSLYLEAQGPLRGLRGEAVSWFQDAKNGRE
jgi:hypothetical protein